MNNAKYKYKIYGRIRGRKKIKFFDNDHYKNFIINLKKDIKRKNKNILDIGSGNGENSIFLGKKTSKNLIIACDVFESGNVNLSNQLLKTGLSNVKIFPYNILNFFDDIKKYKYFNEIWILFPDPWPKNKHRKRRLINFEFIKMLHSYLKIRGKIFIATDSCIYLNSIMEVIYQLKSLFEWKNDNPLKWKYEIQHLPKTKFYKKAWKIDRSSFFIELEKI